MTRGLGIEVGIREGEITVIRVLPGNPAGKDGVMRGIHIRVCDNGTRANFTITDNTASKATQGPVMKLEGIKGLTVTGNKQPLTSGELARISGSSNVTYDG